MTDEVQIFHCLQGRRPFMPTPPTLPASAQSATASAAPLQSALEHHASTAIGLDSALDIDTLQRPTNARDRQLYRNIRKTHPLIADTLTLEAIRQYREHQHAVSRANAYESCIRWRHPALKKPPPITMYRPAPDWITCNRETTPSPPQRWAYPPTIK